LANKPINFTQALYQSGILKGKEFFDTSISKSGFTPIQQSRIERKYRENLFRRHFKTAPWKIDEYLGYDPKTASYTAKTRDIHGDLLTYQAKKGEYNIPWNQVEDWEGLGQINRWEDKIATKRTAIRDAGILQKGIRATPKRSLLDSAWLHWGNASLNKKAIAGIGLGLGAFWAYNHFSGRDDRYNTIEGMPELGMASVLRKQNTPFGSGFREIMRIESIHDVLIDVPSRIGSTVSDVGTDISLGFASLFSGTDDNSNTIEGMGEGGFAAKLRKLSTDFGSGYRGSHFRGFVDETTFLASKEAWEKQTRFSTYDKIISPVLGRRFDPEELVTLWHGSHSVEEAREIVNSRTLLRRKGWRGEVERGLEPWGVWAEKRASFTEASEANFFGFAEEYLGQERSVREASIYGTKGAYIRFQVPAKYVAQNAARGTQREAFVPAMFMDKIQDMQVFSEEEMFGRGVEEDILEGTENFLEKKVLRRGPVPSPLRNTTIRANRPFIQRVKNPATKITNKLVEKRVATTLPSTLITPLSQLGEKTRTVPKGVLFGGGLLATGVLAYYLFSGKDDAYNTIEGMSEKGIAAQLRKQNTEFGSGWRGLLLDTAKEFGRSVKTYKGTILATGAVGLIYGYQKGKKEGEIKWGQFASLIAMDMADDVLLFGTMVASRKFPGLEKIKPYIEHPYVKQAGMGLFGFTIGKLTGEIGANLFSGKDDAYNTIEGLSHKGIAQQKRRQLTDFGSGYRGQEDSISGQEAALMAGGGIFAGSVAYGSLKLSRFSEGKKYPELAKMRRAARKGIRFWQPEIAKMRQSSVLDQAFSYLYEPLGLISEPKEVRGFKGLLLSQGPSKELKQVVKQNKIGYFADAGSVAIGSDKYATYRYLRQHKFTNMPRTFMASDIIRPGVTVESLSQDVGWRNLMEQARKGGGPLSNIVTKQRWGAHSRNVSLDFAEMSAQAYEGLIDSPRFHIFQEKLDLANEFRVVTLGNKPIYSAYRWGSPFSQKVINTIGNYLPAVKQWAKESHFLESAIPIEDSALRGRVEAFATRAASALPYKFGAFDIGLTRSGELSLIEAQRYFGTIKNPLVTERVFEALTGKTSKLGKGAIVGATVLGAGIVYGISNLFSGKDDYYNTIEGLSHKGIAQHKRKQLTDFGSGYDRAKALAKMAVARRFGNWVIGGTVEQTARAGRRGLFARVSGFFRENKISVLQPGFTSIEASKDILENTAFSQLRTELTGTGKARIAPVVGIHKQGIREMISSTLGRPLTTLEREKLAVPFTVFHETGEAQSLLKITQREGVFTEQAVGKISSRESMITATTTRGKVAGHQGFLPIFNEGYAAALHSNEMFTMAKSYRLAEATRAVENASTITQLKESVNYLKKTEQIYGNIEKKLIPRIDAVRIPKQGAAINPLAGALHPGDRGMATQIIREKTPFGSKLDRVKVFAEMAGMTFEKFTQSPKFLSLLSGSKVVRELGAGSFGKAFLRETSIGGEAFQFVEKVAHGKGTLKTAAETALAGEAETLQKLAGTPAAPSFYGYEAKGKSFFSRLFGKKRSSLYMEYIPGEGADKIFKNNPLGDSLPLSEEGSRMIKETIATAAGRGIKHADIAGRNVIYNSQSKEAFLIDWGLIERAAPTPEWTTQAIKESMKEMKNLTAFTGTASRASAKLTESAQDLRIVQEEVWKGAHSAGKQHGRFGVHSVRQQSKHGG